MKLRSFRLLLLVIIIFTINSCSASAVPTKVVSAAPITVSTKYSYNDSEIEILNLINDYRMSIGLNALVKADQMSYKAKEHNNYMIKNNVLNHAGFEARSKYIMKALGAKSVGENVAYNYSTPQAALDSWLGSPKHKANIEGNFTHFGISIRTDSVTGKKYYTNIFAKI